MTRAYSKALPDQLIAALSRVGEAIAKRDLPAALLDEVLGRLDELPAQAVAQSDGQIAYLAGLWRRPPQRSGVLGWLMPNYSEYDFLDRLPQSARLFIFHRDGYVREAALDRMREPMPSAFALASVALRLNDWARPVRIAARRCAERTFPITTAEVAAAASPYLLDRRHHWGRWEEPDAELLDDLLGRPDVARSLAERLSGPASGPLAAQFRYACRRASVDPYIPMLAQKAQSPAVRAAATQMLIDEQARWPAGHGREWIDRRYGLYKRTTIFAERPLTVRNDVDELIWRALHDRSDIVRRVAADAVISRRSTFPRVEDATELMLRDRSPGLRERGAFLARVRREV